MSVTHSDRNLLFGILAMQMDFVSRDALITAMNTWVLDKNKSLGDILVAQQALANKRRVLLDSLVDEHLEQHNQDIEKSLAAVGADGVARAALAEVADADVQASVVRSLGQAKGTPLLLLTEAYQPRATGSRFVALRPHARGGLGEVFVAHDEELHREVALKEIQTRFVQDADSRARFVQEAEITGKLEHPGIVPVYGFGIYEDGRPYYAMRLIRGESLKEAIRRFHQTTHATAGERMLALRKLLGSFLAVCHALGYAHSRGVVHRDVKPDNIMLGKYGETLVVDWGLAKPLAQLRAEGPVEVSLAEGPVVPTSGSGSAQTVIGAALGTPAYMSPEQAAGRTDLISPASDVYSLGATLYCLLTGQPPFRDKDIGAVLQQVQQGQFRGPRELDIRVPFGLEAICRKAMARDPQQRYQSTQDIAADLEHWLADEPVRAFPEPWTLRLGRWARHNRSLVTGVVALLLTAVVGLSIGLVIINAERDEKSKAYAHAEEQRSRAVSHLHQARQAVDTYFTQVSEDQLLHEPGMQELRLKLLKSALLYYQDFEKQGSGDPALRRDIAFAYLRLGTICSEIGLRSESADALNKGINALERLLESDPDDRDLQGGLARCCATLASLHVFAGQQELGERAGLRALPLLEKLTKEQPSLSVHSRLLGRVNDVLGVSKAKRGQLAAAEPYCLRAIAVLERAVQDLPGDIETRRLLALAHSNHGTVQQISGQLAVAERSFAQAVVNLQQLVKDNPRSARCQSELSRSLGNFGYLQQLQGKPTAARESLQQVETLLARLTRENPSVMEYFDLQAFNQARLGSVLSSRGQTMAAIQSLERCLSIWEQQRLAGFKSSQRLDNFGWMSSELAAAYWEGGQFGKVSEVCKAGLAFEDEVLKQNPQNVNRRRKALILREWQALSHFKLSRKPADHTMAVLQQIIEDRDKLAQANLANLQLQQEVVEGYLQMVRFQVQANVAASAIPQLTAAQVLVQSLLKQQPGRLNLLRLQALVHAMRARVEFQTKLVREASASIEAACRIAESLAKADPAHCYDLACYHALAGQVLETGDAALRKKHADQAIAALRQALDSGFDNAYKLRTDFFLESLHDRKDFQEIVQRTESAGKVPGS